MAAHDSRGYSLNEALCRHEQNAEKSIWEPQVPSGSPLDEFLSIVNEGSEASDRHYYHSVMVVDAIPWLPASRERMYLVLIHQDLGSAAQNIALRAKEMLQGHIQKQLREQALSATSQSPPPISVIDFLYPPESKFLANKLAEIEAGWA